MYIVTRQDLTPGYQAVQGAHALRLFHEEHPEIDKEWYQVSNYLGFLSVSDEQSLQNLILRLQANDIKVSIFREPDIKNQITAIAIQPCEESRKLLSNLPNALKKHKQHRRSEGCGQSEFF